MKLKPVLFIFALFLVFDAVATPPLEEGKAIFNTRCAGCHNVNKTLAGPALAGIDERRSMDWIVKFVQSSQAVIRSGDAEAVALFEQFNRIPMPDHPDLTENHIQSVVEFIKSESASAATAPFARPAKLVKPYTPVAADDLLFWGGFLFVVVLLILSLWFAVHVKSLQRSSGGVEK